MKALDGLDPVLEHRTRLAIGVLLARHGEISFSRFKEQLDLTDGNLGAQTRKLEEAGYITVRKDFVERKPVTWYRLAPAGRKTLDKHLKALRHLMDAPPTGA